MMISLRGETVDRDEVLAKLVDVQYERNDIEFARGKFPRARRLRRAVAVVRGVRAADRVLGRRGRAALDHQPHQRRSDPAGRGAVHLPGQALRHAGGADRRRPSTRSSRSWKSGWSSSRDQGKLLEAQRPERPHAVRHRDDAGGGLLPGHRELQPPLERPAARARPPTRCSIFSRTITCCSSTSRTPRCRRCAACSPATTAARRRWSSTASGCPARSTTGR